MKFNKLFFVALVSVSVFVSCTNDNDEVIDLGEYNQGVLVLNEGGSGQGSVSYISNDLSIFTQDVYGTVNGSDLFGKFTQSIFFDGDKAYIISGGSNKITVVNRHTFKLIAKIETGLEKPRYGVVKDGKAYVTNANTYAAWGAPATAVGYTDDYIAVINLTTNLVESKIELNATANRIVLENGKLYISEPYSNDKLLVVNPATKTLETPINVGSDADSMEAKDGVLYVLRSPYGVASEIVKIKLSDKSLSKIAFPAALQNAKNLDIYENRIFYTAGTSVYAANITATEASATALFSYTSASAYGKMYGFAVRNNHIFIADGGDFSANSKAYVYSLSGTLEKEFTVGVGPNGFYFNE
ncbi:YncE family protein [Flavobacterium sp. ZB4P13]|uniref:YncE family protein n=1 Tax=Flavobacterium sp. ZB4P13 TaxID=3401728 RepID=UPI003AAD0EDA